MTDDMSMIAIGASSFCSHSLYQHDQVVHLLALFPACHSALPHGLCSLLRNRSSPAPSHLLIARDRISPGACLHASHTHSRYSRKAMRHAPSLSAPCAADLCWGDLNPSCVAPHVRPGYGMGRERERSGARCSLNAAGTCVSSRG